MRPAERKNFTITWILFGIFIIFTLIVRFADVRAIGPEGSSVGLAGINGAVHQALGGFHPLLKTLSGLFGYPALFLCVIFGALFLLQLLRYRGFAYVDMDLKILMGYYVLVALFYLLFEIVIINYRPVILDEGLEASYPSSHTFLVICVAVSSILQFRTRIKHPGISRFITTLCIVLMICTVVLRLLSGVHWLTDIIGGILLGSALSMLYYSLCRYLSRAYRRRR